MRRVFGRLQIDAGPRRSPSACAEKLKKNARLLGNKVTVIATLPHDAANATIDVASIPANYEIGR